MVEIQRVKSKADYNAFVDLPWSLYKNDPNWVPNLKIALHDIINVNKNPFFKHALFYPLLAKIDGKVVGRIAGVIDDRYNDFHDEQIAFFGFFESINDPAVSHALFEEVEEWARLKNMKSIMGPMNPSTNHECGLLVEGFDDPPNVMMTYNPEYYLPLIEAEGYSKAKDLLAFHLDYSKKFSDRLKAHSERLRQTNRVTIRQVNMSDYENEVHKIREIYNDAWEKNWGFVPMNEEEFDHMAKDMKMILDPEFILLAEIGNEPIGFALALPDVNQALKKIPNGKLFPFGLLKLLWFLKGPGRKKALSRVRIVTLGIKKAYQEVGIGPMFYMDFLKTGAKKKLHGEASWILEDNRPMVKALKFMNAEKYKAYRIFDKAL